jgi:cupin fold WbuC family metalloprotein
MFKRRPLFGRRFVYCETRENPMSEAVDYSMALKPPVPEVNPIDTSLITSAITASRKSPRKRFILPLHKNGASSLQRMLNAIQPGSYIRPHRHAVDRAESIMVVSGAILYLTFTEKGEVSEAFTLRAGSSRIGMDIEGGVWHSFAALEPDTLLFEVKPGPYDARTDKEFARWAPAEDSEDSAVYLGQLLQYATTSR